MMHVWRRTRFAQAPQPLLTQSFFWCALIHPFGLHAVLRPLLSILLLGRWKFKHPGRVGDSPLVGGGLYCDGEVGAAVATGDGEEVRSPARALKIHSMGWYTCVVRRPL